MYFLRHQCTVFGYNSSLPDVDIEVCPDYNHKLKTKVNKTKRIFQNINPVKDNAKNLIEVSITVRNLFRLQPIKYLGTMTSL